MGPNLRTHQKCAKGNQTDARHCFETVRTIFFASLYPQSFRRVYWNESNNILVRIECECRNDKKLTRAIQCPKLTSQKGVPETF